MTTKHTPGITRHPTIGTTQTYACGCSAYVGIGSRVAPSLTYCSVHRAAPDLLAAAEAALAVVRHDHYNQVFTVGCRRCDLMAAIAKAKGEA